MTFNYTRRKNVLFGMGVIVLLLFAFFPSSDMKMPLESGSADQQLVLKAASKTPQEFYQMFQCACCGKPIDTGCCGSAVQRKKYMDSLLEQDLLEAEVLVKMVKQFGYESLRDPTLKPKVQAYLQTKMTDDAPVIEVLESKMDLGTIKQSDGVVSTTFTIQNSGKSDLIISTLETSCMCTSASLSYKGKESPVFGMSMHGDNPEDFSLSIAPGESALLNVFYDPMAHGLQKQEVMKIKREVYIASNDPVDFRKKVRIELIQQR